MAITQQVLHSLKVVNLKNLINFYICFNGSPVTAILGPNGNGKSTVLHALACAFGPVEDGENYKFSSFFLPNTDALWNGSEMEITHSYRDGRAIHNEVTRQYKKTLVRWTPRYANRPKRDLYYIGIDKCVPMIESEKKQAKINYSTTVVTEEIIVSILEKASIVLNRRYSSYNIHDSAGKRFIGVEVEGLRYSALSMSAGEQKVFYILEKIFRAKKNSLILIDELDLLLHDSAMKKLVDVIHERAVDKNLQIIFTTHRESILELEDKVNIRHIICRPQKTLCFNETKPDAINRLTGVQPKPLEVFVEDDLAVAIVKKVAANLRLAKYLSIQRYGAAINCFTTIGGLLLGGDDCTDTVMLLDGDIYATEDEKIEKINRVITGHDNQAVQFREKALSLIYQLNLPAEEQPERYLHSIIIGMPESENQEFNEIIEVAREINVADSDHKYINDIISRIGFERNTGISKIIDLISTTDEWGEYTRDIHDWLNSKVEEVREN